jgi:hypothetical protein
VKTAKEITTLLNEWQSVMREADKRIKKLNDLMGAPDVPFTQAWFDVNEFAAKQVAERIDCDADTLMDWWLVHGFGYVPMRIEYQGKRWDVKNNTDFAEMVIEVFPR